MAFTIVHKCSSSSFIWKIVHTAYQIFKRASLHERLKHEYVEEVLQCFDFGTQSGMGNNEVGFQNDTQQYKHFSLTELL